MAVFRGNLEDPKFQQWLGEVTRNKKKVAIIAEDDIYCYEASRAFQQSFSSPYPLVVKSLKGALVHLIVCQNQQCQRLFRALALRV